LKSTKIEKVASLVYEKVSGVAEVNRVIRLADAAFRKGEFKKVVDLLSEQRIYDRLLDDRIGLRLLADSQMTIGAYKEAAGVLEHVISQFPEDAESHFLLGRLSFEAIRL
jgi:alkyl sulfatase BDS1-like metallo-beta-lactamase superfamily hydrolase